jgi:hypothetical protein
MYATIEDLWEVVFPVGPWRGHIWRIETQASQSREAESIRSVVSSWEMDPSEVIADGCP